VAGACRLAVVCVFVNRAALTRVWSIGAAERSAVGAQCGGGRVQRGASRIRGARPVLPGRVVRPCRQRVLWWAWP
jgi:hypothetical protein